MSDRTEKHVGICPLCQTEQDLIPAGVFRSLLKGANGAPPYSISALKTLITSRQYQDFVFCQPCDNLFNTNGEDWIQRQMWRPRGFPLLEKLADAVPVEEFRDGYVFETAGIPGIDSTKLAYFAVTMMWRMSIHAWLGADGDRRRFNLGPYQEPMRRFLFGVGPFPDNVVVSVYVWPDKARVLTATYLPKPEETYPHHSYSYYLPGVTFVLNAGRQMPPVMRRLCCYRGRGNPICTSAKAVAGSIRFVRNISKNESGDDAEHARQWASMESQSDCDWFKVLRHRFRETTAAPPNC